MDVRVGSMSTNCWSSSSGERYLIENTSTLFYRSKFHDLNVDYGYEATSLSGCKEIFHCFQAAIPLAYWFYNLSDMFRMHLLLPSTLLMVNAP